MQAATETRDKPKARDLGTAGAPEAVSIEEAARIAGLGRSTIYEHLTGAREPKLPSVKMGRRRLIRRDAIRQWLATMERGNG